MQSPVFIGTGSSIKVVPVETVNDEVLWVGLSTVLETQYLKRDFTVHVYSSNKRFLTVNFDILSPYKVLVAANSCLFTHWAGTEQHQHSFGVVFMEKLRKWLQYSLSL